MADGMLSLSWNNHSTTFSHTLAELRHKDKYTDATVACEGKFYPVHQLVLSTCSRYFEEMFEHTGAKHPVVLLQDVRQYELEALLSYMYAGIVSVAQRDLSRLIKVAELLQIKGLAVPDELPGEKKTVKNSHNSSSRDSLSPKSKVLHGGESSDDRSSPHPKRRRKEDNESSSRAKQSLPQTPDSPHIPSLDRSLENSKSHEQDLDRLGKDASATDSSLVEHRDQLNLSQDVRAAQQRVEVNDAYHSQDSSKSQYREKESEDAIVIKEEVWDEQRDSEVGVLSEDDRGRHDDPSAATNPALLVPKEYQEEPIGHHLPHALPEVVVEALAGPSGMHQWLGGGDFSGGSDNYGADNLGSPPPSDGSQPHLTPQMGVVEGATGGGRMTVGVAGGDDGGKVQKCPYCDYSTLRRTHLLEHICTHTGERPHACPYCPSRFVQKGTLNIHIRTHTGEKPFKCPLCSHSCREKTNLRRHLYTHVGKPTAPDNLSSLKSPE